MKILIIKSSALGDIIHSYELIVYLKKKFPTCQLEWVVEHSCAPLVTRHPLVDSVHIIESKKWRKNPLSYLRQTRSYRKEKYDLVIDLQGNIKSSLLIFRAKAKEKIGFGWKTLPEWPNYFFTSKHYNPPKGKNIRHDYLYLAQKHFQDFSFYEEPMPRLRLTKEEEEHLATLPKGGVIVAAYSRWPNKELSEERLLAYLRSLGEQRFYLLAKGEEERIKAEELQKKLGSKAERVPELSLPLLQHFLAQASLVVAVDSLVLHLAGTVGVPIVAFFGPSTARKYEPLMNCISAHQGVCPFKQVFERRCPLLRTCKTPLCLK